MAVPRDTRCVAFLRAINVGGHKLTMGRLRLEFEALGFHDVSTFLASGNVVFEASTGNGTSLETRIEAHLEQTFGYEMATFVRTAAELAAIAAYTPFRDVRPRDGDTLYVNFLRRPLAASARRQVADLSNDLDVLHVHKRELYWLRRGPLMESTIKPPQLDRAIGVSTNRNINTVRRLAAKLTPT